MPEATDESTSRSKMRRIVVTENGPYVVTGNIPISQQAIAGDQGGQSWDWAEGADLPGTDVYALCRCGHSQTAPFCDGTHAKIGFDGTETASRAPFAQQKEAIEGPTLTLEDARPLCAVGRFCDAVKDSWTGVSESDQPEVRELVLRQVAHCPSGRLVVRDRTTGELIEPHFDPSIAVVEDPIENCSGPIWVRGGVSIEAADGFVHEVRNRVTLCRCGQSKNKPFCDGSHIAAGFRAQGPT